MFPFISFAAAGQSEVLQILLSEPKCDPLALDHEKHTALWLSALACPTDPTDCVRYLVKAGADPDQTDDGGNQYRFRAFFVCVFVCVLFVCVFSCSGGLISYSFTKMRQQRIAMSCYVIITT